MNCEMCQAPPGQCDCAGPPRVGTAGEFRWYRRGYDEGFKNGLKAGLEAYAWWKDGVQYVGTCGVTLEDALKAHKVKDVT